MEKLLVVMTQNDDPVENLMPCLESLVKPGMVVIFLFQYPVDSRSYFRDHRITVESARHATAVGRNIVHRYDWEAQKGLAQQIIAQPPVPYTTEGSTSKSICMRADWRKL